MGRKKTLAVLGGKVCVHIVGGNSTVMHPIQKESFEAPKHVFFASILFACGK